jgi:dipeptidyl aminopeptidase/acylaminoacyl peptidase
MLVRAAVAVALILAIVTAGVGLVAQPVSRRPVTVDDLMGLRSILDVKISPAGSHVAYVVSRPSIERNVHEASIHVVPAQGGPAARTAAGSTVFTPALPAASLRWTPDGNSISFLGVVNGRPQVIVSPVGSDDTFVATHAPEGVLAYEWSPDGQQVAYLSREPAKATVVRASDPAPATRLWIQARGNAARALTPLAEHVNSFTWSPDAREIVYSTVTRTGFTAPYYTRLFAVPVGGGTPRTIVDRPGMNTTPRYSPDGQLIAFVTTHERMGLMAPRGLAIVSARPGEKMPIRRFDFGGAWIGEMTWASDSRALYVLMNEGTFATRNRMFDMPVVRVSVDDGSAQPVVQGTTVNYSISISRDGRTLAYRAVEGRTMGDVFVHDVTTGTRTRVTNINPQLNELALGALEPISWSSFDGFEIWGLLLTPPGWDRTTRLPLLVYCHGGPIGGVTHGIFPQFAHTVGQVDPYPTEAMASAGYAVLFPMPRGGSGYGEAGHRAIIDGWGDVDYKDIMAGVDDLVRRKIADPDRLGVMGASYGGFMTNSIVTQTSRFKAASAGASISDLSDMYYLADGGELMVEYFKRPWENAESYRAHSPMTHVDKVATPLLLQHGERDPRVPLASALRFHRALLDRGKTVEFDLYPRGGHVLYEPLQQRESMQRNLAWFRRFVPTSSQQLEGRGASTRTLDMSTTYTSPK